jgi:hypothetical protein
MRTTSATGSNRSKKRHLEDPQLRQPGFVFDFFFLGAHQEQCIRRKYERLPHLKDRISAATETVTPEVLSRVWEKAEYRLDICRATNGAHIENH